MVAASTRQNKGGMCGWNKRKAVGKHHYQQVKWADWHEVDNLASL